MIEDEILNILDNALGGLIVVCVIIALVSSCYLVGLGVADWIKHRRP